MTTDNQSIETTPTTDNVTAPQSFAEPAVESVSKTQYDELLRKYSEVTEQFSALAAEHSSVQSKLDKLLAKDAERELQHKFSKLDSLNLPAERKQVFAELIKNGDLSPEAEAKLFAQYEEESVKYGKLFTSAQGKAEPTDAHKPPQVFAEIIDRNNTAIKQRLSLHGA